MIHNLFDFSVSAFEILQIYIIEIFYNVKASFI